MPTVDARMRERNRQRVSTINCIVKLVPRFSSVRCNLAENGMSSKKDIQECVLQSFVSITIFSLDSSSNIFMIKF